MCSGKTSVDISWVRNDQRIDVGGWKLVDTGEMLIGPGSMTPGGAGRSVAAERDSSFVGFPLDDAAKRPHVALGRGAFGLGVHELVDDRRPFVGSAGSRTPS